MTDQSERLRARSSRSYGKRADPYAEASSPPSDEGGPLIPLDLTRWLFGHQEALAERWREEIRFRADGMDEEVSDLVGEFLHLLTSLLAPGLGAHRSQAEAILQQAAELYGNLGAHRGLAAGEAVEEFQILREVVLRFLFEEIQAGRSSFGEGLRDLLQLNRLIDRGVTYVSVGHTDTLFFSLVHGTGVSGPPTRELLAVVREQVAAIRHDLAEILPSDRIDTSSSSAGRG